MSTQPIEEVKSIDISQLVTIEEQKSCCEEMLESILYDEDRIGVDMLSIQSVNSIIRSNDKLSTSVGEFMGYHFGRMSAVKSNLDAVMLNLSDFLEGDLDELDHGARGMHLNIWYNIGQQCVDEIDECLIELREIEKEMLEIIEADDDLVLTKETIH